MQHVFRKYGSTCIESALVKTHDKLVNRFISCNVNRSFVCCLTDFLSNREQRLKLDNIFGPVYCVPSGIPQGSILGPTLFSYFMGSLSVSPDLTVVLYADDVTLVEPIRDFVHLNNLLRVQEWVDDQGTSLNLEKPKQIIFYQRFVDDVAYSAVPVVCDLKILGVPWNIKLSWNGHFREGANNAA